MRRFSQRSKSTSPDAVIGSMAGIAATVAMTIAMDAMFRRLPRREQYPLPPRELTETLAEIARPKHQPGENALRAATLLGHFGFGAATGLLYACLAKRSAGLRSGIAYGLAVWTVSYFGWVPALRLLSPASQHPATRSALMIAAHVVWGSVLGCVVQWLSRAYSPFRAGPLIDAGGRNSTRRRIAGINAVLERSGVARRRGR
jgi:uncharacterized membrane protein YagU involved in acid resistance